MAAALLSDTTGQVDCCRCRKCSSIACPLQRLPRPLAARSKNLTNLPYAKRGCRAPEETGRAETGVRRSGTRTRALDRKNGQHGSQTFEGHVWASGPLGGFPASPLFPAAAAVATRPTLYYPRRTYLFHSNTIRIFGSSYSVVLCINSLVIRD